MKYFSTFALTLFVSTFFPLYAQGKPKPPTPLQKYWMLHSCQFGQGFQCYKLATTLFLTTQNKRKVFGESLKWLDMGCRFRDALSCHQASNLLIQYPFSHSLRKNLNFYLRLGCSLGSLNTCINHGFLLGKQKNPPWKKIRELYLKACTFGNGVGCNNLGHLYEAGTGVKKDLQKARSLYKQSCLLKSKEGCNSLGRLFIRSGKPDLMKQALFLYLGACHKGLYSACHNYATMNAMGQQTPKNPVVALKYYVKACQGGFGPSCYNAAPLFYKTKVRDAKRKIEGILQRGCSLDFPKACTMYALNVLFPAPPVDKKARAFATRSLMKGCRGRDGLGCEVLAFGYREGKWGLTKAPLRSLQLYAMGCQYGAGDSCMRAGQIISDSPLVKRDPRKGRIFFKRGCALRSKGSCRLLALARLRGVGGPRRTNQAIRSLAKFCMQGWAPGCFLVAMVFREPKTRNQKMHVYFLRRGCMLRHPQACRMLQALQSTSKKTGKSHASSRPTTRPHRP